MSSKILFLFFAVFFLVFSIKNLIKAQRDYKAIDSVADARVVQVLNLGRDVAGIPQFAISYQVLIDVPFDILITPTTQPVTLGEKVVVYYEAENHSNYYIPQKWKIDNRVKKAITWTFLAIVLAIFAVAVFFK